MMHFAPWRRRVKNRFLSIRHRSLAISFYLHRDSPVSFQVDHPVACDALRLAVSYCRSCFLPSFAYGQPDPARVVDRETAQQSWRALSFPPHARFASHTLQSCLHGKPDDTREWPCQNGRIDSLFPPLMLAPLSRLSRLFVHITFNHTFAPLWLLSSFGTK